MLDDDTNVGALTNLEAGALFNAALRDAGMPDAQVDLIFSDMCLNGMIEVLDYAGSQTQGFARRDAYDLRDLARQLADAASAKPAVRTAANDIIMAYDAARVAFCAMGDRVGLATGLAFFLPSSHYQMRRDIGTDPRLAFARSTGWGELLRSCR